MSSDPQSIPLIKAFNTRLSQLPTCLVVTFLVCFVHVRLCQLYWGYASSPRPVMAVAMAATAATAAMAAMAAMAAIGCNGCNGGCCHGCYGFCGPMPVFVSGGSSASTAVPVWSNGGRGVPQYARANQRTWGIERQETGLLTSRR